MQFTKQTEKTEKITGIVDHIIWSNNDKDFHIVDIAISDFENTKGTITQENIHEGVTYEFEGYWTVHKKFGKQFKADVAFEIAPSTVDGLRSYLSSSFFPGIGPVIANKIIKHFGEDTIKTFKEDIDRLIEVPGISTGKLEAIRESWINNIEINSVMMFLKEHNISNLYAGKIYEQYGKDCVSKIKENPYNLTRDIKGIGFKMSDAVALSLGFEEKGQPRVQAAIRHVLEHSTSDGHCYLLEQQIRQEVKNLIELDIDKQIDTALENLIEKKEIKLHIHEEENRYYSRKLFYNERYCAKKLKSLKNNSYSSRVDDVMMNIINKGGLLLSDEQMQNIKAISSEGVSILTGGPGTGKSTCTRALVHLLELLDKEIVLAAPTGRAAQRMADVIGQDACTIHRLLVWDPSNGGFAHGEKNPISGDFIIIDETSMVDINLAAALLRAIPDDAQVLFIGDVDQLPPVGPGEFFKDTMESEIVPTYKLTQIFRQGKESQIIKHAHGLNKGEQTTIDSPLETPGIWEAGIDCMFIESGFVEYGTSNASYPKWNSLRYGLDTIDMIKKLYVDTIPKYYPDKEIQILIPMKVGEIGTIKINREIQNLVNPEADDKRQIQIGDKIFREGDKVIQTANNYDLEVFNGDIGYIQRIPSRQLRCSIYFKEKNKVIDYEKSDIMELELAYAISIHKSQGSEFECVILPLTNQHYRMLLRNLVYTGLTRAKKLAIFVGQRKAFDIAAKNNVYKKRQTSLKEILLDNS